MINIPRYYIENAAFPNEDNEKIILGKALGFAQTGPKRIIFVTSMLDQNDIFKRIFRGVDVKKIRNGIFIKEYNNLYLRHISYSQYLRNGPDPHVLISLYIDSDKIFELEDKEIANANYVLPWGTTGVEKWAKTSGAINLASGLALDPYPFPQQVVIDSMNKIMNSVNTLGFNSTDIELVKNEIKQLKNNGIELNRDEIEAYLIQRTPHFVWKFIKEFRKHSRI